jgi:hypothetical protein
VVVDLTEHLVALGTTGVAGPQDNPGSDGVAGAESPARVIWVADDATGDDPKLSAALTAALTTANPYVIKIAPGDHIETAPVTLKSFVDIEGSGQDLTTITCECGNGSTGTKNATVSADA